MLKFFRTKAVTKSVLWIIIILILPAFLFWGTEAITRSRRGPAFVGIIDSRKVSFDELADSMVAARCQLLLNYWMEPEKARTIVNDRVLVARLAWERLVMLKAAKRNGIKATDNEVRNYITTHPLFVKGSGFDSVIYDYFLRHNLGLAPRAFEEIIRENLETTKLRETLTKEVKVDEGEIQEELKKFNKVPAPRAKLNIDLKEIDKYYK